MSVDVLIDSQAILGEGPRWDAATGRLLWVDIFGCRLHVFDPESGDDRAIELDAMPGVAVPMSDGRVLLALADRLAAIDLEDGTVETLLAMPHGPDMRMNDGNCDGAGRLWVGSLELEFAPHRGTLYRFDGELIPVLRDVTLSNGIGWTPDGTQMYFIDTLTYGIDVLDFDLEAGTVANRRRFATVERGDGVPDGLCVDDEGGVWIALYGGAEVRRYDADGTLERHVPVPAENVTSCAFGGGRLFITSAAPDGRVFVHEPGVSGPPAQVFRSTAPSAAEPTSAA